ncbi:putative Transposase-containing protein 5 [Homarus americanus]|uniref:Putative Transposase-containing protein 5 n=2 Tax=Homarus americanus TaxID=6706 RepID=A0A8J5JXN5_HOMAM|nr:putative Transposase-containing protein 5 [Homarus americanus]
MSRRVTTRDDIAAVIALYKANHVLREISAQTGVALRVVQNLVKRFRDLGEDELPAPLPKSGRPKLLSPRTLKVISRQVRSSPSLTAREVKERNPCLLSHVSLRCVQQALHDDLEFKSFRARRKPLLTKRQKENRVKFCKKYEVWDLETWRSVLWSDEATASSTLFFCSSVLSCLDFLVFGVVNDVVAGLLDIVAMVDARGRRR